MTNNVPGPPSSDPGPIWEHLPVENFGTPRRQSGVVAAPARDALDDLPSVRPNLAEMFETTRKRFLLALVPQVAVIWLAIEAGSGLRVNSSPANVNAVVTGLLIAITEAVVLVFLAGARPQSGLRAWLRVVTVGAIIGASLVLISTPQMISDEQWVDLTAAPAVLVLGLCIQIRWGLAPLIALNDGAVGIVALRGASREMRGHSVGALLVVVTLGAVGLAVVLGAYVVGGADTFRDIDTPLALLLALTSGVTQTLWLTWLASLFRRIRVHGPRVDVATDDEGVR